ncbi:MAG: glycosyltransferase family 2 protein [Nitrospirae bacterium]|nr:glycosyltransferase family 2 protein [Nitrospirota bacterium]
MELSVLIVNWNTKEFLKDCLQSLYSSVKNISFEVIVVDNNSGDGSVEMVKKSFPEARLIENTKNAGFARGNNQAYAASKGRVIGLLNPDTIVYPGTFEKMMDYLHTHDGVGAVSCKFLNPDGTLQKEFYRRFPTVSTIFFRYTHIGQRINQRIFHDRALNNLFYYDKTFEGTEIISQPGATCLLMRRSLIERIGLFDEQFPILFNDVDLCKRIWKEGYEIHVLADAHITHYGGTNIKTLPKDELAQIAHSGIMRYFRKHHGLAPVLFINIAFCVDKCISIVLRKIR